MSGFGLAPLKKEGSPFKVDVIEINPYQHPKYVTKAAKGALAKQYFIWELLHGTPIETLQRDKYWKYYEE
jgi:hypothetical protein